MVLIYPIGYPVLQVFKSSYAGLLCLDVLSPRVEATLDFTICLQGWRQSLILLSVSKDGGNPCFCYLVSKDGGNPCLTIDTDLNYAH
jgi:hypothetical protein